MPIVENDPWRKQYFDSVVCPDDVTIPTDDALAYTLYPAHRWIYNKLLICETQGLTHAPHGIPHKGRFFVRRQSVRLPMPCWYAQAASAVVPAEAGTQLLDGVFPRLAGFPLARE